ncbi:MAG: TlpA disulfide reductase family protein [Planctomycetota bacterium]
MIRPAGAFAAGAAVLAALGCGPDVESAPRSATIEPDVSVVDLAGLESALQAREGRGYLLNVWAIWCAPCVQELPELIDMAHEWRPRGGDVVGISYDLMVGADDPQDVRDTVAHFIAEKGWDFDVLVLDEPDYDAINERFDLPGAIPVTLAIDAEGTIVDRQSGVAGKERFAEMMARALGAG